MTLPLILGPIKFNNKIHLVMSISYDHYGITYNCLSKIFTLQEIISILPDNTEFPKVSIFDLNDDVLVSSDSEVAIKVKITEVSISRDGIYYYVSPNIGYPLVPHAYIIPIN